MATIEYLKGLLPHIKTYSSACVKVCHECVMITVVEIDESAECEMCDRFVCPGCEGLSFCDDCNYFLCVKCMKAHECEGEPQKSESDSETTCELVDLEEEELRVYNPEGDESMEEDEHFDEYSSEPDEITSVQPDRVYCDVNDSEESE